MKDWLRPLAPLGYVVGAFLMVDVVVYLVSQGPFSPGNEADRARLAMIDASRLSALAIGLVLIMGAAILAGHRKAITPWLLLAVLTIVGAVLAVTFALEASPQAFLSGAESQRPDYLQAAGALRARIIVIAPLAVVAVTILAFTAWPHPGEGE